MDRYQRTGAIDDLESAIREKQKALDHFPSAPIFRLRSSRFLLNLYVTNNQIALAHEAACTAVSLVPLLAPRFLRTSDKQHLLTDVVCLASDAAAIALLVGKTLYDAISLLELGRGVISNSLTEIRWDISDLQLKHPAMARDFDNLRNQLDSPQGSEQTGSVYAAGRRLDETIQQIRKLPTFERFLLALSEDEVMSAAVRGPIVVINVSRHGCDALILEQHQLRTLKLSSLQFDDIEARAEKLRDPQFVNLELMEWLWDKVAEPILQSLGFIKAQRDVCPRIWWIPTGPLASFPIHGAGRHSGSGDTVIDRVISSYSSSVSALVRSRQNYSKSPELLGTSKIVLVGMEQTPSQKDLPFASLEVDRLATLCENMKLQIKKPQPFREQVITAVRDCTIFHFAGHGSTNPSDPSQSSMLLSDGELTVADLFETNLHSQKPFLAYLSACGAGQMKHDGLINEGIHLIGAFQLAGFQHVIGTLWEVSDESCVTVATRTYRRMKECGMSDDSVSEGLHHTCKVLRDQWSLDNAKRIPRRH